MIFIFDFHHYLSQVISASVTAVEVEAMMQRAYVKMKLIVDKNNKLAGLITLNDISAENLLNKVHKSMSRGELLINDFMHRRESLKCIDYNEVTKSVVSDVLEIRKSNKTAVSIYGDSDAM